MGKEKREQCGCGESADYLETLRMVAHWLETGESTAPGDGGGPCLCDEIDPRDKPCIVCSARSSLVLAEVRRVAKAHGRNHPTTATKDPR